ncbi:hypothetical protein M413DRAFT_27797 [Hebeloma cylindrosporum]|uniref:Uncharacterized protein n=1 Tax=Hebeloma cylindrosporum TaxID=76867 RepID=A0A0C2XUV8_HEBCY|nr:hypothetical protein M413DRAFT_27797 [Hebeloma cylindrosporum h7]
MEDSSKRNCTLTALVSNPMAVHLLPPLHAVCHDHGTILPTEILEIIFEQVIGSHTLTYSRAIIPVLKVEADTIRGASQVCRLWRAITLEHQIIWGTILNVDFNSIPWIEELIRRSGSKPLLIQSLPTVDNNGVKTRDFSSDKWALVLGQTHRFWKLDITFQLEEVSDLHSVWERPAPLLEYLALRLETHEHLRDRRRQGAVAKDGLFSGVTPKMKHLILDGIIFTWRPADNPSLNNIVRLDLTLVEMFLCFRVYSPLPESESLDPGTLAIDHKMHFHNLQELAVTGSEWVMEALSLVVIPSTCMVSLSFTDPDCYFPIKELSSWLEVYFLGWRSQSPVYSWSLFTSPLGDFAFHAGTKQDPPNRPQFVLEYNTETSTSLPLCLFLSFLRRGGILEQSTAVTLDLRAVEETDGIAGALRTLLYSCSNVSELRLLNRSLGNIVLPMFLEDPDIACLRKLVIDGPNPKYREELIYALSLILEYLGRRLENGGERLSELTFFIDKSAWREDSVVWDLLTRCESGIYCTNKLEYRTFKRAVIERGELPVQNSWSLQLGKGHAW